MSTEQNKSQTGSTPTPPVLKPCCACPETKKARDECILQNGQDACLQTIEAHIACMKAHGFDISNN